MIRQSLLACAVSPTNTVGHGSAVDFPQTRPEDNRRSQQLWQSEEKWRIPFVGTHYRKHVMRVAYIQFSRGFTFEICNNNLLRKKRNKKQFPSEFTSFELQSKHNISVLQFVSWIFISCKSAKVCSDREWS